MTTRPPLADAARDNTTPLKTAARVDIGEPAGSGKTALIEALVPRLTAAGVEMAVIINDLVTCEDADRLIRQNLLAGGRVQAVEAGACPHTVIRENPTLNIPAADRLNDHWPALDLILLESGGNNLASTFSLDLVDWWMVVIDVAGGGGIPRKKGPGVVQVASLVINKTVLALRMGADLLERVAVETGAVVRIEEPVARVRHSRRTHGARPRREIRCAPRAPHGLEHDAPTGRLALVRCCPPHGAGYPFRPVPPNRRLLVEMRANGGILFSSIPRCPGDSAMWPQTPVTKRLGIAVPIIQAPMAGASTPALAAAAAAAGALGSLGLGASGPAVGARQIQDFRHRTGRPLNANFFAHDEAEDIDGPSQPMRARLAGFYGERGLGDVPQPSKPYTTFGDGEMALIEEYKPEVVSFHFGLPDRRYVEATQATGAVMLSSATTVAEARWLEQRGVDMIIAQGLEAGGHRGTFLGAAVGDQPGLFALLPQVVSAVSVPVIAAGGVVDARTIAAALMLGAQAVQMGTAFLRCPEAATAPAHRAALATARDDGTRTTRLFSGKPARGLVNRLMRDLADMEDRVAPYPAQISLMAPLKKHGGHHDSNQGGDRTAAAFSALWSGQSAALTREMPAGALVRSLVEETTALLDRGAR